MPALPFGDAWFEEVQVDQAYQPYLPMTVGRQTRLVLGKHSDRHALRATIDEKQVKASEKTGQSSHAE